MSTEPREFWLEVTNYGPRKHWAVTHDSGVKNDEAMGTIIKVIEHSAYQALEQKLLKANQEIEGLKAVCDFNGRALDREWDVTEAQAETLKGLEQKLAVAVRALEKALPALRKYDEAMFRPSLDQFSNLANETQEALALINPDEQTKQNKNIP
jgi:hypothetical protein